MAISNASKRNESIKRKSDQVEEGKAASTTITMSSKRLKSEEILRPGQNETPTNPSTFPDNGVTTTTSSPPYFIALPCSPPSYYSSSLSINSPSNGQLNHDHHQPGSRRRPDSKKLFAIHQHPDQQMRCGLQLQAQPTSSQTPASEQDEFFSRNGWIASTLVATYLIEVAVQILLIVECCRSIKQVDIGAGEDGDGDGGSSGWFWFLVLSPVLSSFLVTLVSLVWVFQGMDFSGRVCGRLLCYVMHSFLLGLLWRYLKLAFAYDKADLEEFFKLKAIHSYIQSLPLVTIHLAWVLGMGNGDAYQALSSWLVVAELLSAVTSLVILPQLNNLQGASSPKAGKAISPGRQRSCGDDNVNDKQFNIADCSFTEKDKNSISISGSSRLRRLLKSIPFRLQSLHQTKWGMGRAFLLSARIILLGMLLHKMSYYWTGFITLSHLSVCLAWIIGWLVVEGKNRTRNDHQDGDDYEDVHGSKNAQPVSPGDESDSSNDSGLVVKSEIPEDDHYHHVSDMGCVNERTRDNHPVPYPNCLSIIIHRRRKSGVDNANKIGSNSGTLREAVLTRAIPLTYVLFWDVSSSPAATILSRSNDDKMNVNLWGSVLPIFLAFIENIAIVISHWKDHDHQSDISKLSVAGAICLLIGWLLIPILQLAAEIGRKRLELRERKRRPNDSTNLGEKSANQGAGEVMTMEEESDEGINCNIDLSGNSDNDNEVKPISVNKETGEWLPLCCSSLSHPLNIKRKGQQHHHHQHDLHLGEQHPQPQSFCKNLIKEQSTLMKYNEYEEQQELGRGMKNGPRHRHHQHYHHPDNNEETDKSDKKDECGGRKKGEDASMMMSGACATASTARSLSVPVTNSNYTNIKEALTRRISNKSCTSSLRESHYHPRHHLQHQLAQSSNNKNCMNQTEATSTHRSKVKGEGGECGESVLEKRGEVGMTGLISSSSSQPVQSSAPLPHQHPQPTLTNSQKCIRIPISIKSPISWLPLPEMQCCNESSGSSSSNSRNTNTFDPTTSGNNTTKSFYCQEKSADLDNHIMKMRRSRTEIEPRGRDGRDDFAVVFFEGGAASGKQGVRSPAPSTNSYHPPRQYNQDDDEEGKALASRNRITGNIYLSDGASLTSLDGLCQVRASTPVEIKKASRVIVNHPPPHHKITDSKTVSRCLCNDNAKGRNERARKSPSNSNNNSIYEKLMDDSYGILICEGESNPNPPCQRRHCSCDSEQVGLRATEGIMDGDHHRLSSSSFRTNNNKSAKLRILCKKCLFNHDPLLTNCTDHFTVQRSGFPVVSQCPKESQTTVTLPESESDSTTTDYPSDTEFTVNNPMENDDGQSLSTHFSSATYSWHPNNHHHTPLSQFIWAASSMMIPTGENGSSSGMDCPKEFTSLEYVRTWLMASHPRVFPINGHSQKAKIVPIPTPCDKASSKRKRFRQLEKRQRPVGRGASPPPATEVAVDVRGAPTIDNNFNSSLYANTRMITATTPTGETCASDKRFEPQPQPPSRKQHPLLVYDLVGRQEEQRSKPLTATTVITTPHKKCRDQLDLFHKELETVV